MFTNGLLTIAQQQVVEAYVKRQTLRSEAEKKSREIGVKIKEEAGSRS
jgi:hypothetical protein